LSAQVAMVKTDKQNRSGIHIGQQNTAWMGLDFHLPVFLISAVLAIVLVVATLVMPQWFGAPLLELRVWITTKFDWYFILLVNLFLLFLLYLVVSRLGDVRLGGNGASPKYNRLTWFSMLFAAGVGIGLMFFGVLEPLSHSLKPPLGIDPADLASARAAGMAAAIFHWGLHAWAIYGVIALSLAFFAFNQGLPLLPRSAFHPLLGAKTWGPAGHIIDITAVLATLFGLATSLGFGAEQIAAGLHYLFGVDAGTRTKVLLIMAITGIALWSVYAGLDRGVRRLSELNVILAFALLLFVLLAGPTLTILRTLFMSTVDYLRYLPSLSNWIGREDTDFVHGWTTFFWAWWISWSPFVGMFIARVSYGRTVREFIVGVLIMPAVISIAWMATFGGTALEQYFAEAYTGVANSVPELALFKMLEHLPYTLLTSALSVVLIAIFFVTSADSGALVMDTITAGGNHDSPTFQRMFWCVLSGLVALTLMFSGGMAALQALTISISLPFGALILLMGVGLYRGLSDST
jgi:BCCT family betaine/carnitine transporter